jgi:hypothetical protein
MIKVLSIAASLALVLAACAAPNGSDSSAASVPENLVSPVDQAVSDLQALLDDNAEITVVLVEDVTWPDGSLGCPQPGMSYTQALVDGYRIVLSDGETEYAYHGAVGREPFLCENGDEPATQKGGDASASTTSPSSDEGGDRSVDATTAATYDGPLKELVVIASADLAERQGVLIDDVVVVSAQSVVWPDGSLGCPIPDMSYTQVQVDGTKIVLSIDGGIYNYHSGANRGPFLCIPIKASDTGTTGLTLPGNPGLDE